MSDIHLHFHIDGEKLLPTLLESFLHINTKLEKIMSTQAEIAQALTDLGVQVAKVGEESKATLQKVADLEAELAKNPDVSPALQAAFDGLKTQVQKVDDLIPDAPVTQPG